MAPYLNTEEAAAYLGIRERKLYELVAQGAVPCSKVTGKMALSAGGARPLDRGRHGEAARLRGRGPAAHHRRKP